MKHLRKYNESFSDIRTICNKYYITDFTINSDGTIDADEVDLSDEELSKLPLKFRNISKYFFCYNNQLTSLEGCPEYVGGSFYCHVNELTSLEGCPKHVGIGFGCEYNQLTSLHGGPESVGGCFDCSGNRLTSLEGAPKYVRGFQCGGNPVWQVWNLFRDYSKIELFNDYDIIRDGDTIILDRLNSFLQDIGKPIRKKVEGYRCI